MRRLQIVLGRFLLALAGALSFSTHGAQDVFTFGPNDFAPSGGPNPGYYISNVSVTLGQPNLLWVTTRLGGIYKSVDAAASWGYSGFGVNGSAIVRGVAGNLALTEGDAGVYRTSDGGATWNASNSGLACRYVRNILPDGPDLIAATNCRSGSGFYRNSDAGATWSRTWTSLPDDFRAWGFRRVDANEIYVSGNYGIFRSTNNGASFTPANGIGANILPATFTSEIFAFTRRTSGHLVAHAIGNGVYYSTNSGADWFPASGLPANSFSFTGFQGTGSDMFWTVDGVGLFKSTNNGVNWSQIYPAGLPASMVRIFFSDPNNANVWWAGTLSGIYQSSGAGNNGSNYAWTKKSTGLPGGVHAAASHPANDTTFLAVGETVYKSIDGGSTWSASGTGLGGTTAGNYQATIESHVAAPETYYLTTSFQGVFKSTNAGGEWFAANNGFSGKIAPTALRIAPSDASTLYATAPCGSTGRTGGVYKSTNAGASWTDVSTSPTLTNRCANSVNIHPSDPNTVYVATSRALYLGTGGGIYQSSNGNAEGGLYKTTNGGTTWKSINPGNVAFAVGAVDILASNPNVLLLRSHVTDDLDRATAVSGVFVSKDGGDSWTQLVSNHKIREARFVQTPSGRVDAYGSTEGYFDEPSNGELGVRCTDLLNEDRLSGKNCTPVRLFAAPGTINRTNTPTRSVLRFVSKGNRVVAAVTSSGIAMQSYRFLGPDFNNDGAADIWWKHTDGRNHIWNLAVSSGSDNAAVVVNPNTSQSTRTVGSPWVVAGFGDFNRDGHTDALWRNTSTGDNYLFLMDNGAVVGEGYLPSVPANWVVSAVGDFNGDGYADIWWTETTGSGLNYVYLMGIPSGSFPVVTSEGYMPAVYGTWSIAGTGDFNGDGKADIWYRNSSTGDNYIYLLNGLTITSQGYTTNVPTTWSIAGFGDFNGDGNTDVIWREATYGYNYLYPMSGLTVLGGQGYLPTVSDTTWTVQGTGDTNKDGISDILWRQNSTGYNFVWRMNGTQVMSVCGSSVTCFGGVLPVIDEPGWSIVNK